MSYLHYSGYWHRWSRVLAWDLPDYSPFVEVNLTPIHNWQEEVIPVVIRRHGTARNWGSDYSTNKLPENVFRSLLENVGEALADFLLHGQFLNEIDWAKYERACNGGAPLEMIKKNSLVEPTKAWREMLKPNPLHTIRQITG